MPRPSEPAASAWVDDPAKDSWEAMAPLPEPWLADAAVALGERIYVVGGVGLTPSLLTYDPGANGWASFAPMLAPCGHVAAEALAREIYALVGRRSGEGERAGADVYDPPKSRGRRPRRWAKRQAGWRLLPSAGKSLSSEARFCGLHALAGLYRDSGTRPRSMGL